MLLSLGCHLHKYFIGFPTFSFGSFYRGVSENNKTPQSFINNDVIRVQYGMEGSRGGSVERWVICNNFEIQGSGFYYSN